MGIQRRGVRLGSLGLCRVGNHSRPRKSPCPPTSHSLLLLPRIYDTHRTLPLAITRLRLYGRRLCRPEFAPPTGCTKTRWPLCIAPAERERKKSASPSRSEFAAHAHFSSRTREILHAVIGRIPPINCAPAVRMGDNVASTDDEDVMIPLRRTLTARSPWCARIHARLSSTTVGYPLDSHPP